ncbi:hypothetical protein JW949_02945 [Candidatus Woesearchaeota archaeon]|nr:hypothetical protein [Candidatus Woesearchaeota archaeon]
MGREYRGPEFRDLPEILRGRIRKSVRVAEETYTMGVVVLETKKHITVMDILWKPFGNYREVFAYSYGVLYEAYFRMFETDSKMFDTAYTLTFCGSYSPAEMEKVEKALELDVIQRPLRNQDETKIKIRNVPLEKLVDFDYSTNSTNCRLPSGPFMGRK